jgi:hypothetical protein
VKRLTFIALLALGCDDPEVAGKVASVLEHGIVAAHARCQCEITPGNSVFMTASKLIDGSCLVADGAALTRFWTRTEANSETCEMYSGHLQDGEFVYHPAGHGQTSATFDIESCCTGFEFESFGVE